MKSHLKSRLFIDDLDRFIIEDYEGSRIMIDMFGEETVICLDHATQKERDKLEEHDFQLLIETSQLIGHLKELTSLLEVPNGEVCFGNDA